MIFAEQKTGNNTYTYTCEDVFGTAVFTCSQQLDADTLDAAIMAVLGVKTSAEELNGDMPFNGTNIFYTLKKQPIWEEDTDEGEYKQEHTTLTYAQALKCWIKTVRLKITHTIKRLRKYVVLLRSAWKNSRQ